MSTLSIVATPIGNLEDITLRALRVLKEADTILCEDTRVTKKLLDRYDIKKPLVSFHARSSEAKFDHVIDLLEAGKNLALVSDAGTPTISDPGARLVSEVRERFGGLAVPSAVEVKIVAIPGASALTAALSISGVPVSEFLFLGFLPHKKGRETLFQEIAGTERAVVFYESPHRILKTLDALGEHLEPSRTIILARELTKIHEEILSGTPEELSQLLASNPEKVRGEFVVIVSGR